MSASSVWFVEVSTSATFDESKSACAEHPELEMYEWWEYQEIGYTNEVLVRLTFSEALTKEEVEDTLYVEVDGEAIDNTNLQLRPEGA